jgi:hypothetical protein
MLCEKAAEGRGKTYPLIPRLAEIQLTLIVHFNNTGWETLGSKVAAAIRAALNSKR